MNGGESRMAQEAREYIENMSDEDFNKILAKAEALPCTVTSSMIDGQLVFHVEDKEVE